jgi:hypothetical protein
MGSKTISIDGAKRGLLSQRRCLADYPRPSLGSEDLDGPYLSITEGKYALTEMRRMLVRIRDA